MAPWKRFLSFISNEIQAVLDPEDSSHNYKKWFDIYSSQEFEASTQLAKDMLDKLSISLTREELNVIENLYNRAMKLVVDFFCAQPIAQQTMAPLSQVHDPAKHRLTIFSDFDLGSSATDTSAILAQIAIVTFPKADSNRSETQLAQMSSDELRSIWAALSVEYADEYEQCIESIMPSARAGLNVLIIHSNELVYEESICTGEIVGKLESPMEKLQAFNVIRGIQQGQQALDDLHWGLGG